MFNAEQGRHFAADLARGLRAAAARADEPAQGRTRGGGRRRSPKLGLTRTVALTTPRFVAVPFLVAGAPVVTTMHARLARFFAAALGLSLSPAPVKLPELSVSLVWHASYDHDPAHMWLRRTIMRVAAEVGWKRLSA